jgi:MFS family permease
LKRAGRTTSKSKPPPFLEFRSSTVFIVAVVCLAVFTDILLYGLIVPVIPFSLSAQAGVPEDQVQHWTAILLACYNAALFVGSPIAGFYADHTSSRRWPFLLGLIALCASTLLLCLGKTVAILAVGRILQGLSAAIVWSVGLALLVDTVGRDIGYAMGYVNIAMSVGLLISPIIGGAVYAAAGYYAVYYIAFAVIFCDIALRLVMIEKRVARQWLRDDGSGTRRGTSAVVAREQPGQGDVSDSARALHEEGKEAGNGPAASPSPTRAGGGSDAALSAAARHPHRELIRNRRILAVLLGVAIEAAIV